MVNNKIYLMLVVLVLFVSGCTTYELDDVVCPENHYISGVTQTETGEYEVICSDLSNVSSGNFSESGEYLKLDGSNQLTYLNSTMGVIYYNGTDNIWDFS